MDVKKLAKLAVARVRRYPRVFKYLTYDSGLKMLQFNNLQFTRADKLNDTIDCDISKVDFSYVADIASSINRDPNELILQIMNKHKMINLLGVCSLGITADNDTLWERYTQTKEVHDGICIELDLESVINCLLKKGIKTIALVVDYVDDVINTIPYEFYIDSKEKQFIFLQLLLATKNIIPWKSEQELRLIFPKQLSEEYFRQELFKSCFKSIYLGRDMTIEQRNHIKRVVENSKYKIGVCNCN